MENIDSFIEAYIELESSISELMKTLFSSTCELCTACCCRADICEESTYSAFLRHLLRHADRNPSDMDDRYGWLASDGCALEYGRPPICYAFFCDELLARLPDVENRWATQVLGRLLDYVGENALPGAHLVEIEDDDQLKQVDTDPLMERIEHAQEIVAYITHFFECGRLGETGRRLLQTIPLDEL